MFEQVSFSAPSTGAIQPILTPAQHSVNPSLWVRHNGAHQYQVGPVAVDPIYAKFVFQAHNAVDSLDSAMFLSESSASQPPLEPYVNSNYMLYVPSVLEVPLARKQELMKQLQQAEHKLFSMHSEHSRLVLSHRNDFVTCSEFQLSNDQLKSSIVESQIALARNKHILGEIERKIEHCTTSKNNFEDSIKQFSAAKDIKRQECNDFLSSTVVVERKSNRTAAKA